MGKALVYINGKPQLIDERKVLSFINSGKVHRDSKEGPALCLSNGTEEYYKNGVRHREDGPAILSIDRTKKWYINDKLHRIDGPAIIDKDGYLEYYKNGKLHRLDGPAICHLEGSNSDSFNQWWIDGEKYAYEEWLKEREKWIKR